VRRTAGIAFAVAERHLRKLLSTPALWIPPLVFPLFFFTAFAGGLSAVGEVPDFGYPDYTGFQYVFVLFQTAAFGGVFTGFSMAGDWQSQFARRMMLAAPHRFGIVLGYVLAAFVRTVVIVTIVTVVALIAGMQVGGSGVDLVGLYVLAAIVNLAATLFAAGVATRFRSLSATPLMQIPVFLVLFMAPVYTPRHLLSGWVHAASAFNPATAFLEAGRGLLSGEPVSVLLAFGCALGLVALLGWFALRGMRSAERAG
jgi:ABC-type multidrug transport system permease subunit